MQTPHSLYTLTVAGLALAAANSHAIPTMGVQTDNSCFVCHGQPIAEQPPGVSLSGEKDGRVVTGKMSVTSTGETIDLGTQLDGQELGPLKTFKGTAGTTFQLLIDVLDGIDAHAVQLKQLEKGGQKTSQDNFLDWTASIEASTPWEEQSLDGSPPYFTLGVLGGEDPTQYTFNLVIDEATPVDVYDLVFSLPGQDETGLFYQEEHFYLEVTEAGEPGSSNDLINISTRGLVGVGGEIMIAGFVSAGDAASGTVLIRGIGPTLGGFGVANTVEDPVITVFRTEADGSSTQIAANDDWGDNQAIAEASATVGAFALDAGSKDAAILLSGLTPGAYTVQLSGKGTTAQNGLIEVYQID